MVPYRYSFTKTNKKKVKQFSFLFVNLNKFQLKTFGYYEKAKKMLKDSWNTNYLFLGKRMYFEQSCVWTVCICTL